LSFHKFHFANLLADGIFVSTREVLLSTSMVTWTLFTRNYTMIGYLGRSVLLEAYIYIYIYIILFLRQLLSSLKSHTCWCIVLPRGMKRRDFLLRRYWRREDDGTYGSDAMLKFFFDYFYNRFVRIKARLTSFHFVLLQLFSTTLCITRSVHPRKAMFVLALKVMYA
jgi:hypothetical protein